jgi:hypothetical protein
VQNILVQYITVQCITVQCITVQCISRGKPIRFGFKLWALCTSGGSIVTVEPYCGSHTRLDKTDMGQGPDVVKGLVTLAKVSPGTKVYFDNLFTTVPLSVWMSERGLGCTGTVRQNRLVAVPIPNKKKIEKSYERGQYTTIYTEDIVLAAWRDNKPVYVLSNCHPSDPPTAVKRWNKVEKKKVELPMPTSIACYNRDMGGVDLNDQMVACYRPRIRKRKWWWCFLTWSLAASSVNAWRLMMAATNSKAEYLPFLRGLVIGLLKTFGETRKRPGRSLQIRGNAGEGLRMDGFNHWIVPTEQRLVCKLCGSR